jgi:DNA-binding FadR family transcriptional regulator
LDDSLIPSRIREAVKALAAKGLVEPRPRLGTRVLPRDSWNLMDREVIGWHGESAVLMAVRAHRPVAAHRAMRRLIETTSTAVERMLEPS